MKAFGVAALIVALASPVAAQQTAQGNQPRQDTTAGAGQNTSQTDRTPSGEVSSSPQDQGVSRNQQEDRDAPATSGQNDRRGAATAEQRNAELPATASLIPAMGILGFLSLVAAAFLRRRRVL